MARETQHSGQPGEPRNPAGRPLRRVGHGHMTRPISPTRSGDWPCTECIGYTGAQLEPADARSHSAGGMAEVGGTPGASVLYRLCPTCVPVM
jgi:hypothetical protein